VSLEKYRNSELERKRTDNLLGLIPEIRGKALDVGARDGHFSKILAKTFIVTALDLEKPSIKHQNVDCVAGDVTNLPFSKNCFDLVFCTEVLEHIPTILLKAACNELERVTRKFLIIGVPFNQDIRVGRSTCYSCWKINPPWGHVNCFDLTRLEKLFNKLTIEKISFVGEIKVATNKLATLLMDLAGNPYGTYTQKEPCVYCGNSLKQPPKMNFINRFLSKMGIYAMYFAAPHQQANWIHILFRK
jgi:hypothetical protein